MSVADLPYFSKSSAFLAESKYILVLEEIVKQNTAVVSSSSSSCGLATGCGSSQTTHGSWCKGTINSPNEPLETIAQGHLFTARTSLLRTSQPKDSNFRGEEGTSNEEVVLRNVLIYRRMGSRVELYRMAKKAI